MRTVLILGGTAWLGREIAANYVAAGDAVTCLARGESGAPPEGARLVKADRRARDAYRSVAGQHWDDVVELSYEPDLVGGALDALAERAAHWTLVSSVSVYARNDEPGVDESAALLTPVDMEDYGQAKVAAEVASSAVLGDRLLIARAGLIAGPGDGSDRFGYWVSRMALAGHDSVLIPDATARFVQAIDVRDLAGWIAGSGRAGVTGVVNAVGNVHPLAAVFALAADVAGFTGGVVLASDEWLLDRDVQYWAGPRSLPLWLPQEATGFTQRSNARFAASGGRLRPLRDTIADTLLDERMRGLERERRSGLTRSDELSLLAELGSASGDQ